LADDALAQAFRAQKLDWIVPAWDAPARVHAFMTTRNGGASEGTATSLDVGDAQPRSDAANALAITENCRRIARWLPASPVWLAQVHGRSVAIVDGGNRETMCATPAHADALVTRETGVALAIRVADCVPVLFAARDAPVIAAAHAGWRGLAAGVLEATLTAMRVPGESVVAWLGPSIGANAFEVGDDVVAAFCNADADAREHFKPHRHGKWLADLHALAQRRLLAAGVDSVRDDPSCTYGEPARFFSYRRDGATGRMAALIWQ